MSDQVSVRLAVVGGSQFRTDLRQAGAEGVRSMQQMQAATKGVSPAFQQVAMQASQMFGTMSGGSPALASLSSGLARAALSGGAVGLALGAAVTVLGSLVPLLTQGGKSAAAMAAEMTNLVGSTGAVTGAVSALEAVQRQYTAAIEGSAGASGASAAAVVANSRAEFEARKQVLAVELELLRIRGAEQAADLKNLQDQFRMEGQRAIESGRNLSAYSGDEAAEAAFRIAGVQRPRGEINRQVDDFLIRNEQTTLAMRKLRAEATLTNLTIKQTEEAMATTFKDIGTGGTGKGPTKGAAGAKGGAGGAASAVNKAVEEGKKIFDETRTAAERYAAEMAKLNDLLAQGAIDQDTYNRKAAQLASEFQSASKFASSVADQVRSSMSSIFDAIVQGGGKAGEVIEGLGRKLLSMALQESTFRMLARFMPATFGANGFIPLLPNANGNAFGGGQVIPFANGGVVSSPTLFPMRGATGLMGEAGPEAIMPLTRIGGKLGVRSAGGAGGGTMVQVNNYSGQPAREERERGPNGEEVVRVIVGDQLAKGRHDGSMTRFGARPMKARRG
jgi:hypothetical protein